jgi:uncharacterized membrane protein
MNAAATRRPPGRFEERGVPAALQGLVSRVLRGGVLLSGCLILVGALWEATTASGSLLTAAAPSRAAGFSTLIGAGGPSALVLLGILVLFATPLSRVAISTTLFASSGDRTFASITLIVLLILAVTIVVGVLH